MMKIATGEARARGYGSHSVTIIDYVNIPMTDNINLSAKIWYPEDITRNDASAGASTIKEATSRQLWYESDEPASDAHYPAVLEYLPYRKSDWTAERDHLRHPWTASHGYVVIRVDMRGSGTQLICS